MRGLAALCVVVASGTVMAACQTVGGDYTVWRDIGADESRIQLPRETESKMPPITRRTRSNYSRNQEYWRWAGGEMFMEALMPGRYFDGHYDDTALLVQHVGYWKHLKDIGFSVSAEEAKWIHNSFSDMVYAVKPTADGKRVCFVSVAYWAAIHVNVPGDGNPSAYSRTYSCVLASSDLAPRLEQTMVAYYGAARFVDR